MDGDRQAVFVSAPVSRLRSKRRFLAFAALGVVTIIAPAIVLAASFGDVPPTHPFYAAVERVYAARITGGCGGGNYCPDAAVTRGQMAAFLGRAAGAAEQATGASILSNTVATILAEVSIRAGEVTGGTAYVQVFGTFGAYTQSATPATYPYKGAFALAEKNGPLVGFQHYVQITALASDGYGDASGALQVLLAVPTGVTKTYQLIGLQQAGTNGQLNAYGTIDAMYVPFSAGGGWINPNPGLNAGDKLETRAP